MKSGQYFPLDHVYYSILSLLTVLLNVFTIIIIIYVHLNHYLIWTQSVLMDRDLPHQDDAGNLSGEKILTTNRSIAPNDCKP